MKVSRVQVISLGECGPLIPSRVQQLCNTCTAVHFLSLAHQSMINSLVRIKSDQYVIAPAINLSLFRPPTPMEKRKAEAMVLGDSIRVAETAERRDAEPMW